MLQVVSAKIVIRSNYLLSFSLKNAQDIGKIIRGHALESSTTFSQLIGKRTFNINLMKRFLIMNLPFF